jgi:hypothetical protein
MGESSARKDHMSEGRNRNSAGHFWIGNSGRTSFEMGVEDDEDKSSPTLSPIEEEKKIS